MMSTHGKKGARKTIKPKKLRRVSGLRRLHIYTRVLDKAWPRKGIEKIEEEEVELLQKLAACQAKKIQLRKRLRLSERRIEEAVAQELDDIEAVEAVKAEFLPPDDVVEPEGLEMTENPYPFFDVIEMPPTD